jgi:hypothetical protein
MKGGVSMPKAIPVTYGDFLKLEAMLRKWGFVEISRRETLTVVVAEGLVNYKVVRRGEVGFKYFENGYVVKVWTSCLREEVEQCRREPLISQDVVVSRPVATDLGWILITDRQNKAQYFARPTMRTKHFIKKLIARAGITTKKVQCRPLCAQCGTFMQIHQKPNRATFWECRENQRHIPQKPVWKDWDFALTPHMLAIVREWRKEYHRYLAREKAKGHVPRHASEIRKRWIPTRDPYPSAA